MNPLLKKLNFKNQEAIAVLNAPPEFNDQKKDFTQYLEVNEKLNANELELLLAFVLSHEEIKSMSATIDPKMTEDGLVWFAYPKKSSKVYKSEINRDHGWQPLGDLGYEPVRSIAIDEYWTALRFKKAKNIKNITRDPSWIMSEEGRKKAKK